MKFADGPRQKVQRLTREHTGRWLVTTQRSTHLWDLDAMTYVRNPRSGDISRALDWDGQKVPIWRVLAWPAVGERFGLLFANPELDEPDGRIGIKVRISSPVCTIEYVGHNQGENHTI